MGCQIDLLVQTPEARYTVEIKRKARIGAEIIDKMKEKCRLLPRPSGISLRTVLVYSGKLAPTIETSGYFAALVMFGWLLGT